MIDLGWKGEKFTWSNRHEDETFTKERLCRGVAYLKWSELFSNEVFEVLNARCSDHKLLFLSLNVVNEVKRKRKGIFR